MGRRRKLVEFEQTITANEDKASNAGSVRESDMEKQRLHAENSNATNVKDHVQQISNVVENEKSLVVRRSNRLKSFAVPTVRLGAEPVVEHVFVEEDEMVEEDEKEPEPIQTQVNGRNLEERASKRQDEGTCPEIRYKNLYIDSQKKIEALMEENYDLVRKLEFARGKIAAYEAMKNVVGAQKEVILVSPANLSSQAVEKSAPFSSAGVPKPRKKYKKQSCAHGANNHKPKKADKVKNSG